MSKVKEDEKNERLIRGLLKLPHNRKCINCNTLGPQYVCTTFSSFVCTTCSGIHREFTHRVKSISMAKFTPQEIASLQAGGNERAREIFFKEWDPQRHSAPDSSNVDRLRDFIKHLYVDRRYTGDKSTDRPPRVKPGEKEDSNENRRSDAYSSGSRSPPYEESYERRYSDRSSPGYDVRRSPGYDQENQRQSDYGRSPVRSGIVSDWRREDRFANGRKSEDRRSSDGESKPEIRSPDRPKDSDTSGLPTIRPVKDILGENITPLRISEPPKANNSRVSDGSTLTQRTASSSSLASSNGHPTEIKRELSLIDFDTEPEPTVSATVTQASQQTSSQSAPQSTSAPAEDNWACFDSFSDNNSSQVPPTSSSFESALTDLSVTTTTNGSGSATGTAVLAPSNGAFPSGVDSLFASGNASTAAFGGAPVAAQVTSVSSFPSGGAAAGSMPPNGGLGQWSGMQHQQQPFPHVASSQPTAPHLPPSAPSGSSNQGLSSYPNVQTSQSVSEAEVKPTGRKELPADLFTFTYPSVPYQAPGWQAGMHPGMMGYHMQYNPGMMMQTYPQPSKASNPFDVNAEASPVQAAAFPSMSPLHAALPNTGAPGSLVQMPNVGTAPPSWMPPTMSPSASPFGSALPGYLNQQQPNNMMPSRPQGFGSFGSEGSGFGSLNPAAAAPNTSLSGNPFG